MRHQCIYNNRECPEEGSHDRVDLLRKEGQSNVRRKSVQNALISKPDKQSEIKGEEMNQSCCPDHE